MEENNENEKSLPEKGADKVKQFGKNEVKKGIAHIIKPLLPAIITAIVTFLACLLVIGFMLAVQQVFHDVCDAILGIFDSSKTSTATTTEYSSNFLEAAQQVHDEEMGWEYFYGEAEGRTYEQGKALLRSPASAALDNKNKVTCCATYVSCVLYASGHFTEEEIGYDMHSPLSIYNLLEANLSNGWEKITNKDALRPGDIVLLDKDNSLSSIDHVQIYAGDNKWYNAGNTYDIQHTAPKQSDDNWDTKDGFVTWWAYRPPVEPKNPPAKRTPDSYNGQIISIDRNGAYKLNSEDLSKKILEELERQKVNNKVTEFDLDELGDMINKYIEAEVKTTYPKIEHPDSDIDGMIVIKRASADLKNKIDLKYKKYDEFCELISTNPTEALQSFSLNPQTFELCIATQGAVTKYYDFDDNEIKIEGTGGIEIREINYQKLIQNNITPVNFFVILHLISQDAEFMNELVELALGKEKTNPLELTYVDNLSTFTETHDFEGNISYSYSGSLTEEQKKQLPESVRKSKDTIYNKDVEPYYDIEYHKKVNTVYGGKIYVTNADTWLTSASKNVSEVPTCPTYPDEGEPTVVKSGPISPKVYPVSDEETEETVDVKVNGYIEIKETITNESTYTKYTVTTRQGKINVDNFVDNLIGKYPKVKENILSAPDLLFNMLQRSEKTQTLEKIMRYVLYKLTDLSYGVTEENLLELFSSSGRIRLNRTTLADTIIEVAQKLHNEQRTWKNYKDHTLEYESLTSEGIEQALNNPNKTTSPTTYVCSVLYKAKCIYEDDLKGQNYNSRTYLDAKLKELEWEKITDEYELKAGDIVFIDWANQENQKQECVRIYAGSNNWYGADSTSNIQSNAPYYDAEWKDNASNWWAFRVKTDAVFEASNDKYITGYYTSTTGRKFTILDQSKISYNGGDWHQKCNRAAAAIIASGYSSENPEELITTMNKYYDYIIPTDKYWELYGLKRGSFYMGYMSVSTYTEILRKQLQSGGYAAIWLNQGVYYGLSGEKWTGNVHWVAVIDYTIVDGEEKIAVADWRGVGWYDIDEFCRGINNLCEINEK